MNDNKVDTYPRQMLSYKSKTEAWVKKNIDWADNHSFVNYSPVRASKINKKINLDLYNGKLHVEDMDNILNPGNVKQWEVPEKLQHFPVANSKIDVLIGEESTRIFDYRVSVTNPDAVSEIEENKKKELLGSIENLINSSQSMSQEEQQEKLREISEFYQYKWQDIREIRANQLMNHYWKEYNLPLLFNNGFTNLLILGECIYRCHIVAGEPVIDLIDPLKVEVIQSGFSNRVEDADMIIYEDYWSPGRIFDTYHEELSKKSKKQLQWLIDPDKLDYDTGDSKREPETFIRPSSTDGSISWFDGDDIFTYRGFNPFSNETTVGSGALYDSGGNIRVLQVFWKSKRKIKKVKRHNIETGEEDFDFFDEDYVIDEDKGEEEEILWINEAWQGVKIGKDIYVDCRPCDMQFNSMSNPSKCHFGFIGSFFSTNESRVFSFMDKAKPFSYLYDVVHDKLNKLISKNWGRIITLDLAKKPSDWDVDKWMYYARENNLAVINSFNEGTGLAAGRLAGALNNASTGVIDADMGNSIQYHIQLLEYINEELSGILGVTKQREGQVQNRETVGGVERATLQSSCITERYFMLHEDCMKRVLECFIETAKIASKGKSMKFKYTTSDMSEKLCEIDGDEFAECEYGITIDNSQGSKMLQQNIEQLSQFALQGGMIDLSSMIKMYGTNSIREKAMILQTSEKKMQEQRQQEQQQQQQIQQQQIQAQQQQLQMQYQHELQLHQMDNEARIRIAEIQAQSKSEDNQLRLWQESQQRIELNEKQNDKDKLAEDARQFNEKMKFEENKLSLERDRLDAEKEKNRKDAELKKLQINKQARTVNRK